jgi:hypothetical protein
MTNCSEGQCGSHAIGDIFIVAILSPRYQCRQCGKHTKFYGENSTRTTQFTMVTAIFVW